MLFKIRTLLYYLRFQYQKKALYNPDQIKKLREKRTRRFFRSIGGSDFYRELIENNTPLSHFPNLNKKLFMEKFDLLNTAGIKKSEAMKIALEAENTRDFQPMLDGITIGLSSGTAGNKGLFLASENERSMWVAMILSRLLGFSLRKRKIAFFLRASSNLYSAVKSNLLDFQFYDLLQPLNTNLAHLEGYDPDILVAQPSMLKEIALAKKTGKMQLSPSRIISVAEILEPEDKALFQSVFNLRIDEAYQCTEGFLASSCEHGTLHFHEDFLIIDKKYIDKEQKRFHPVITDLLRTTQPVINYELDDVIIEKTHCPCGNVCMAIEKIEGRSDDIIRFEDYKGEEVMVFPDYIRRAVITASDSISFYSIIQTKSNTLKCYLEENNTQADDGIRDKVEENLRSLFNKLGIDKLILEFTDIYIQEPGHKLRRVKNEYSASG